MEIQEYADWSLGVHQRLGGSRVPLSGTIELTQRCNHQCVHCYNNLFITDQDARQRELAYDDWRHVIDEIAAAGCLWLLMTGGEIFLRNDFLDIYTYARQKGLLISLFTRKTRFAKLREQLREIHMERKKLITLCLILLTSVFGTSSSQAQSENLEEHIISREYADHFGKLLVQSRDGRIIPINTTASDLVVKMYKKNTYHNLNANQVFLSMMVYPQVWRDQPLLKVYDKALQNQLGIKDDYVSYNGLFDDMGRYKLKEQVDKAYAKPPAQRTKFEKELIRSEKVDLHKNRAILDALYEEAVALGVAGAGGHANDRPSASVADSTKSRDPTSGRRRSASR